MEVALSVTAFSRASSPRGRAKGRALPARRSEKTMCFNRRRWQDSGNSAAQPPLAPPLGELASEARLRGRRQLQIWERCGDCSRVPSQSRLSAVPAPPKGEPRGGRCPPGAPKFQLGNLVVQPALSVTAFSRASSPKGRTKGRLRRPPSTTTRYRTG